MGHKVFKNLVRITRYDLNRIKRKAICGNHIFNKNKKRVQASIDNDPVVLRTVNALYKRGEIQGLSLGPAVALHSFAGCKRQQSHCDYDPDEVIRASVKPKGVLIGLQDEETHMIIGHKKVRLHRGDVLIFDGDVVHAGGAYFKDNTRVHVYMDSPDVVRIDNATYFINGNT